MRHKNANYLTRKMSNPNQRNSANRLIGEVRFSINTDKVISMCPICGKEIYDDPSNLIFNEVYFHFNCVLSLIKSKTELSESQDVYYIGSNNFAVVWEHKGRIEVLRKIHAGDFVNDYVKKNI